MKLLAISFGRLHLKKDITEKIYLLTAFGIFY